MYLDLNFSENRTQVTASHAMAAPSLPKSAPPMELLAKKEKKSHKGKTEKKEKKHHHHHHEVRLFNVRYSPLLLYRDSLEPD